MTTIKRTACIIPGKCNTCGRQTELSPCRVCLQLASFPQPETGPRRSQIDFLRLVKEHQPATCRQLSEARRIPGRFGVVQRSLADIRDATRRAECWGWVKWHHGRSGPNGGGTVSLTELGEEILAEHGG